MANWNQQKQFLDFFSRHGVSHVNLAALCPRPGGDPLMKGQDRARDHAEAEKSLGWAWHENQRGAEVYIRPARWMPHGTPGRWPLVFLDDVSPAQVAEIGQFSALVVETSPGRCHVWLAVSRPLDEEERKALQTKLAGQFGGDFGSISGEHFGRLPGFRNHKRGGIFANIKTFPGWGTGGGRLYPVGNLGNLDSFDVAGAARPAAACASQHAAEPSLLYGPSESEREFGYVIGRLRWSRERGTLETEIELTTAQLVEQAAARGKQNPRDYAERTVAAALRRLR